MPVTVLKTLGVLEVQRLPSMLEALAILGVLQGTGGAGRVKTRAETSHKNGNQEPQRARQQRSGVPKRVAEL